MWRILAFPVLLHWVRGSLLSMSMSSFCHWNWRSSPVAWTLRVVCVPVATDWLLGSLVIFGGSTKWKMIKHTVVYTLFTKSKYKLTNWKTSFLWRLFLLFNWILYQASVVTFVIFLCVLNTKCASVCTYAEIEPRLIANNVSLIFLPLELKIISCGFNSEGCICSSSYWLALWIHLHWTAAVEMDTGNPLSKLTDQLGANYQELERGLLQKDTLDWLVVLQLKPHSFTHIHAFSNHPVIATHDLLTIRKASCETHLPQNFSQGICSNLCLPSPTLWYVACWHFDSSAIGSEDLKSF